MPLFLLSLLRLCQPLSDQGDAQSTYNVGVMYDEGRGVPQILAMGALTRLDCALGTAGLMRQALSLASLSEMGYVGRIEQLQGRESDAGPGEVHEARDEKTDFHACIML